MLFDKHPPRKNKQTKKQKQNNTKTFGPIQSADQWNPCQNEKLG